MVRMLSCRVITDGRQFEGLRQEWDSLLDRSASTSVFLTWEWLYTWWRHFGSGNSLRIAVMSEASGRIVGIAPMCVYSKGGPLPLRVLSFLGNDGVSSEYLDIFAEQGLEAEVAAAFFEFLKADSASWDYVIFSDLLDSSIVLGHVGHRLKNDGCLTEMRVSQNCPYLPLPSTADEFLASLGKEMRSTLKRRTRRLFEMGVETRLVEREDEIEGSLASLFQLHQKRWTLRGLKGNFRQEKIRAFHAEASRRFLEKGRLRLYLLNVNGSTIASLYCFAFKGKVFYYQAGFDPEWSAKSPGTVLMGHGIQSSIAEGMTEFDFLRGLDPYKFRWTDKSRTTHNLIAIPKGKLKGMFSFKLDETLRGAKRYAKQLIRRGEKAVSAEKNSTAAQKASTN